MFRRRVTAQDKISIRFVEFEQVDDYTYSGAFISQAGREYEFSWDREVGFLWLHDAAKSYQPEDSFWRTASKSVKEYVDNFENLDQMIQSISSVQSVSIPARRKLIKGARRRELGISKASGFTVYYALDQTKYLAYFKRDGGPVNQMPEEINTKIVARRAAGDDRKFVAVVEGQIGTLEYYRDRLTEPDFVIYVSDETTLDELGVKVIDRSWSKGQGQINLNSVLANRSKKKQALNFMEENEILQDNRPVDTDDRIPEEVVEDVKDFITKKPPKTDVDKAVGLAPTHDTIVETETTELVDIVRRQQVFTSVDDMVDSLEREADFEKYSEPEDEIVEDEVIAKEAIRFLSGAVDEDSPEVEESSSTEFKVGQIVTETLTGDRGRVVQVEGNKLHVKFEDSDEVTSIPIFMVE